MLIGLHFTRPLPQQRVFTAEKGIYSAQMKLRERGTCTAHTSCIVTAAAITLGKHPPQQHLQTSLNLRPPTLEHKQLFGVKTETECVA